MDSKTDERKILESTIQSVQKKLVKLRSASYSQDPRSIKEGAFKRRLIVVSNRLPVTASRSSDGSLQFKQSSGGLVSAIQSVRSQLRFLWIGWLGIEIAVDEQKEVSDRLLSEYNCIPVFLPEAIAKGLNDVKQRNEWQKPAPKTYALPTETWREVVARRQRATELLSKLANGEINQINDLITYK
jgi:hypothetical protein